MREGWVIRALLEDPGRVADGLQTTLFASTLSSQGRLWLARQGAVLALPMGACATIEGEAADAAFVVLCGRLERSREGRKQLPAHSALKRTLIDELAVLEGGVHPCTLVAATPCRLWRIPRPALVAALEREPAAAAQLVMELSGRLREAAEALHVHRRRPMASRLARMLLAEQNGRGLVGLTQTEMARRLDASRERVNRKLNEWAREDWVELTRAGVRIHLLEKLRTLAGAG